MSESLATLFQRLTQGVYVVGVTHEEVRNAFTAAWIMQVSFDPLLLALSINPQHSSYGLLKGGRAFSVNVCIWLNITAARPLPTNWLGRSGLRTASACP
jgi:flavin reductase (DIM6/NTAB) family NADH-FMN oxidoreductase RutF